MWRYFYSDVDDLHATLFGSIQSSDVVSRAADRPIKTKLDDRSLFELITSDESLYKQILQYQPVAMTTMKKLIDQSTFKVSSASLVQFLDKQVPDFQYYCFIIKRQVYLR